MKIFNDFELKENSKQELIKETTDMIKAITKKLEKLDGYALVKVNETINMAIQTIDLWSQI